ncbi:MAG: metal-dependent hydrolase [Parvibaculum sp.]
MVTTSIAPSLQSRTPADVQIEPRNMQFDIDELLATDWHSNDPFKTAYFNALSIMFPLGEKAFIDAVNAFRDQVSDPKLAQEIRGFVAQESIHSREHHIYNKRLCAARGYDLARMEKRIADKIAWSEKNLPKLAKLYGTVAYEHYTAIMADALMQRPQIMDGAAAPMAAMWRWHAIEEAEHKAVAFDVLAAVGCTTKIRRQTMFFVTLEFVRNTRFNINHMLKADGYSFTERMRIWAGGLKWLFGSEGILRGLGGPLMHYMANDFHPWQHDNRALLESVKQELGPEPSFA